MHLAFLSCFLWPFLLYFVFPSLKRNADPYEKSQYWTTMQSSAFCALYFINCKCVCEAKSTDLDR